jgi:hypothetical protein
METLEVSQFSLQFGISGGVKRVKLAVIIALQTIPNVKES